MTARLSARAVSLGYRDRVVVDGLDLDIVPGAITAIVGANGCGKSTLLRALARLVAPQRGEVLLDDRAIGSMRSRDVAAVIGLLPQQSIAPEGITVVELARRGRHPHLGPWSAWSSRDEEAVASAIAVTGLGELVDRPLDELSGGQRQRAWIAMILAQETDVLLLDEPTSALDLRHQIEVLDLLVDLNDTRRATIVMVVHDLNLAARYADQLVAMRDGSVYAVGDPSVVVSVEMVRDVFGVESAVVDDPIAGTPLVVPRSRRSPRCRDLH